MSTSSAPGPSPLIPMVLSIYGSVSMSIGLISGNLGAAQAGLYVIGVPWLIYTLIYMLHGLSGRRDRSDNNNSSNSGGWFSGGSDSGDSDSGGWFSGGGDSCSSGDSGGGGDCGGGGGGGGD